MATEDEPDATPDAAAGSTSPTENQPDTRLSPLFEVLDELIVAAEESAASSSQSDDYLVDFDSNVLVRGIKGLKSARILIRAGQWEYSTAVARQIFELLINMEYLYSLANREAAVKRYSWFGFLQFFLSEQRRFDFMQERSPGKTPSDWENSVRSTLDAHFDEFKLAPRADGTPRWRSNWSGKTAKALAELSSDPMRAKQYDLLFSTWSEQTHATPSIFTSDLFDRYEEEVLGEAMTEVTRLLPSSFSLIGGQGRREAHTLSMVIVLFTQLWRILPNAPRPIEDEAENRLKKVKEFMARRVLHPLPIAD
ncbi:DUF5677 domain-containing protein [Kitasatospora cineracea]|uniref:DUF5677 domain-containing protein n=1 Tax=Kitasatospora cineracea TaxID=88074 RepID=UPI0037B1A039